MKRIVIWLASTITVLVLLFGYRTSTNATTASPISSLVAGNAGVIAAAAGPDPTGTSTASTGTSTASTAAGATNTFTGAVADTRWGPVQVQITVAGGTITAVDVVQYPSGNGKDQQINARALPILVQETLSGQSASVDMVSGATVTSDGYVQSLQSALDEAGL